MLALSEGTLTNPQELLNKKRNPASTRPQSPLAQYLTCHHISVITLCSIWNTTPISQTAAIHWNACPPRRSTPSPALPLPTCARPCTSRSSGGEWGEEAFAVAQRENKPVLLDIGAVWCHWCHVMDRESYDSPEIAQIVNERFIAIKVDRDERPDIDSRYQVAVSAISGQGGWPLTAFLTPEGKPFYGGTYFPPDDHYGRPSFKRVLLSIADAYHEKNGDVIEQAKMVENAISQCGIIRRKAAPIFLPP